MRCCIFIHHEADELDEKLADCWTSLPDAVRGGTKNEDVTAIGITSVPLVSTTLPSEVNVASPGKGEATAELLGVNVSCHEPTSAIGLGDCAFRH